jgi:predicted N-acetyltransferase YhbS
MEIRPLREADDRTAFRSGEPDLDRFFAKYAGQNQFRHHIGTTCVAVEGGRIQGFATVAPGNIEGEALPMATRRRLPHYPLPVLRLARLAVDASARSAGVGGALLRHVFLLALEMAAAYGCVGVVVDAKPDAVSFYERFGFAPLDVTQGQVESRPRPTTMFLPLELVALAIEPTE